jgi:hypothetical protein
MKKLFLFFLLLFISCDLFRQKSEVDKEPPSVKITYPSTDDVIEENIVVKATATDNNKVQFVRFYIDGDTVLTDKSFPYEYFWDITYFADGKKHTIFAESADLAGNIGQSEVVNVRVSPSVLTVPLLIHPANATRIDIHDIRFQWRRLQGACNYELTVSGDSNFNVIKKQWIGQDTVLQDILLEAGLYYWKVRAQSAEGRWSQWSDTRSLYVIDLSIFQSSQGLVAYYPLNGNAYDESPNGHHGVVHDAVPCEDRLGNPHCAFEFNGNAYINFGDIFNDVNTPFSISLWIFCKQYPLMLFESDCFTRQGFSTYIGFWFKAFNDGKLEISYGDGNCAGIQCRRSKYSYEILPLNQWVHVAASVQDSYNMKIFINGQEVNGYYEGDGGGIVHNYWPAVLCGYLPNGCKIDEVRIYNRAIGF